MRARTHADPRHSRPHLARARLRGPPFAHRCAPRRPLPLVLTFPLFALGPSFSPTFSRFAGKVEIIANDQGNRVTLSYVAFSESERLIGDAAKNQASLNPTNTAYDATPSAAVLRTRPSSTT